MVKIDNTATSILNDSGAQSKQFNDLVKSGLKVRLQPNERNLWVYEIGCLLAVGKFEATIECRGEETVETILVMQGEGRCLIGSPAAKWLQVL